MNPEKDSAPGGTWPGGSYALGPLPWSEKTLIDATWKAPIAVRDQVGEHPGKQLDDKARSLASVLRIFNRTASRIQNLLKEFQAETVNGTIFWRSRANDLRQFEEELQELLYLFASSAMTLVDQTRALSKKVPISGYDDRVSAIFSENPEHRLVQELRNDVIHVKLHEPSWQLSRNFGEESVAKFLLKAGELPRSSEYNQHAKMYLDDHKDGIDVGQLVEAYAATVNHFQKWLHQSMEASIGYLTTDYRRSIRCIERVSVQSFWRLIFSQVVLPAKRDPFQYLEQYLTQQQLAEVHALPHQSKEQVDRIIELVDDRGACDAELRSMVYEAFGVVAGP